MKSIQKSIVTTAQKRNNEILICLILQTQIISLRFTDLTLYIRKELINTGLFLFEYI